MADTALAPSPSISAARATERPLASILSVATELPPGPADERRDRRAARDQRGVDPVAHGHPRASAGGPDERLSDYAARAGAHALERAGVDAADLDLVIVATMSPGRADPEHGAARRPRARRGPRRRVRRRRRLHGVPVRAGARRGSDRERPRGADPARRRRLHHPDHRLRRQALGAAVRRRRRRRRARARRRTDAAAIGPIVLGADGSHARQADRRPLRSADPDGRPRGVPPRGRADERGDAGRPSTAPGSTLDDIDLFVYHQANARITSALGERLGLPPERVVDCIETLGNASAATLPVALAEAERDGRLRPGARVLLSAFGAGFTWGGGVIEWGGA